MKDNRWGIVPVIWRTAQSTDIHFMFPTITRIYSNEQRLQHEYCTTFLSLPTIYHDLCNLKITKFIIFQFLSIGAVARHKTFFLNFFISSLRISCFVQCPQSPSSSSLLHQVSLCFFCLQNSRQFYVVQVFWDVWSSTVVSSTYHRLFYRRLETSFSLCYLLLKLSSLWLQDWRSISFLTVAENPFCIYVCFQILPICSLETMCSILQS